MPNTLASTEASARESRYTARPSRSTNAALRLHWHRTGVLPAHRHATSGSEASRRCKRTATEVGSHVRARGASEASGERASARPIGLAHPGSGLRPRVASVHAQSHGTCRREANKAIEQNATR